MLLFLFLDVTVKRNWLKTDNLMEYNNKITKPLEVGPNCKTNKRERFIILGSSGEYLPIKRLSYCSKSYNSSDDEYLSAKSSLDSDDEYDNEFSVNKLNQNNIESDNNNYNNNIYTPERRLTFAYQLSNILNTNNNNDNIKLNDNNYSVDISINGSEINDTNNYKLKRNNSSCGFILTDNDNDNKLNDFNDISFDHQNNKNNHNYNNKQLNNYNDDNNNNISITNNKINNNNINNKVNFSNNSSNYSFSTEYSSELEEVFDQFSK